MPATLPPPLLAVPSRSVAVPVLFLLLLAMAPPLRAATVTLSSGTRSFDNALDLRCVLLPCAAHAPPARTAPPPSQLALLCGWYRTRLFQGRSCQRCTVLAAQPSSSAAPCPARSSAVGRTMRLLYTLAPDGTLTGALVTDLASSSQYAGLSFGAPHRGTPTVIYTTSFLGECCACHCCGGLPSARTTGSR